MAQQRQACNRHFRARSRRKRQAGRRTAQAVSAEDAAAAHNEATLAPSPSVRKQHLTQRDPGTLPSRPSPRVATATVTATPPPTGPSLSPTATLRTPVPPTHIRPPSSLTKPSPSPHPHPPHRTLLPLHRTQIFSAQILSALSGDKFVKRFDANCYIHLTRKMDSHDVARSRWGWSLSPFTLESGSKPESAEEEDEALMNVLSFLSAHPPSSEKPQPPAVFGGEHRVGRLVCPARTVLIHKLIEGSRFVSVKSTDGHDGFLLEFEQINQSVGGFLREVLQEVYQGSRSRRRWDRRRRSRRACLVRSRTLLGGSTKLHASSVSRYSRAEWETSTASISIER